MIFKYKYRIYNKINREEKVVIGATQAREAIKDLLSFDDVSTLSNRKISTSLLKRKIFQ